MQARGLRPRHPDLLDSEPWKTGSRLRACSRRRSPWAAEPSNLPPTGRRPPPPPRLDQGAHPFGRDLQEVRRLLGGLSLHTVCAEAQCPNVGECWDQRTATIMILGDTCTRACGFCAVKTGKPTVHDLDEPRRVAEAIRGLGLDHVVVTSVARDDLADGGASCSRTRSRGCATPARAWASRS